MNALIGGGLAATFALPVGLAAVLAGASSSQATAAPNANAVADIPAPLLSAYRAVAANCPGLPWSVLAAIGKVESDHGRSGGATLTAAGEVLPHIIGEPLDGTAGTARVVDTEAGRLDGDATWDRAVGPMQFLPGTWMRWGRDASGDGTADPHNAFDAIAGAGAYLCGATGRVDDLAVAVLTYNRSAAYLNRVLAVAAGYATPALSTSGSASAAALASHPNLALSAAARADLESGLVDPRVVATLGLAADRFSIHVGVIRTGHSQCVGGGSQQDRPVCSVSQHWYYRGVDIDMVGGQRVAPGNQAARALADSLIRLPPPLRPDELGVPWAALAPLPGVFSDAAHQDHLHLGYRAPRPVP
ncbi:MAG TPA: lytic transglycosylase domain-containing protein [Acidimicrobiales bacterium]|nr:lytic transglycosylase domain-containing protein [Acidimicrobiales bacterium]